MRNQMTQSMGPIAMDRTHTGNTMEDIVLSVLVLHLSCRRKAVSCQCRPVSCLSTADSRRAADSRHEYVGVTIVLYREQIVVQTFTALLV